MAGYVGLTQQAGGNDGGATTVVSAARATTTGNHLQVSVVFTLGSDPNALTCTDTAGNVYALKAFKRVSDNCVAVFRARNITGNAANVATVGFGTSSPTYRRCHQAEFSGPSTQDVTSVSYNTVTSTNAPATNPTLTLASAGYISGTLGTYNVAGSPTPGSGYTLASTDDYLHDQYRIATAGTYACGMTLSGSDVNLSMVGLAVTDVASSNGNASGVTLAAGASIIAGSASGVRNGTASAATISASASMIGGGATASGNATASGTVLPAAASILSGSATGQRNATAPAATIIAVASIITGGASGNSLTSTTYEAESGAFGGGGQIQAAAPASGGQVIGNLNSIGSYSQVLVAGGAGGSATVVIRFSNAFGSARSLGLYVNGVRISTVSFPNTGDWMVFADSAPVNVTLAAGSNALKLQLDAGDVGTVDVDRFVVTTGTSGGGGGGGGSRNAFKQPFAVDSIWNMPIGSGATYVDAQMTHIFADVWASMPYADEDVIILTPAAPATPIRQGSWAGDRCPPISGTVYATVPIPNGYTNPSSNNNLASAVLAADGRTLVNVQPLTRCTAGQPATAIVRWPDSDLYGDGIDGAHGGSGMSSIGGTLRVGELRPGDLGVPHALKLIVYMREAHRGTSYADCYRWPAKAADGYAVGWYGADRAGPTAFKMGALLAILPSINILGIGLETEPGRQIAWTLQNYGGYVVDDSYGGQFGITTERGPDGVFVSQFAADFGFAFDQRQNATGAGAAWMRDIQRIVDRLHVVSNNGPTAIGGGGTPRQPLAAALAEPGSGSAGGVLLTATASLIPGAATGQRGGNAAGVTVSCVSALLPGAAIGVKNASAPTASIGAEASLIPGGASGQRNASAAGRTFSASSTMLQGAATGVINETSTGQGAILTAVASIVAGEAAGTSGGTAEGAVISAVAALVPGAATADGAAPGAVFGLAASLDPGSATSERNAEAPGAILHVAALLIRGSATAGSGGVAPGALLVASAQLVRGLASGTRSGIGSAAILVAAAQLLAAPAHGGSGGTAPAALVQAVSTLIPGSAGATSNGTAAGKLWQVVAHLLGGGAASGTAPPVQPGDSAPGMTRVVIAAFVPGGAAGQRNATAPAAVVAAAASLIRGAAAGGSGASVPGVVLAAGASIHPGPATGGFGGFSPSATVVASVHLIPGSAGGTTSGRALGAYLRALISMTHGGAAGHATVGGAALAASVSMQAGGAQDHELPPIDTGLTFLGASGNTVVLRPPGGVVQRQ